ncbi:MAG: DUF4157 domain-containing protein [Intrasporangium sp.]|uniref:eCIS core domain-containing protein n=1 Tax=Intrasporangium sp. TaxID=1925024 RepID=UPI002647CEE7|nr:DUF4157 domain-containing protein [Intrasporangium sp.]MDN5796619.1 DUF4157 domain-containing protein [Intrasporangium sp.]
MRTHDQDRDVPGALRPTASPRAQQPDEHLVRAAVAGRADVVGAKGMIGLQQAVGNAGLQRLTGAGVHELIAGGSGQSLDGDTRADMEGRLGADFGDVRIHTGARAHESAQAVGAHAYTVGQDIVFQRGAYDTQSSTGRTMLAHELTHVIQQRSGPVDGTPVEGGVRVSDPSDRFEREAAATADRVMSSPAPAVGAQRSVASEVIASTGMATAQREADEDESVQGAFLQREEEEAPEEEASS